MKTLDGKYPGIGCAGHSPADFTVADTTDDDVGFGPAAPNTDATGRCARENSQVSLQHELKEPH